MSTATALQSLPQSVRDAVLMQVLLDLVAKRADVLKRNDPCPWHLASARHLTEAARLQRDRVTAMKHGGVADALIGLNVGGGITLPDLLRELGAVHAAKPAQIGTGEVTQ